MRLIKNNRGDTIVEVLMVIAIMSAVLGTAYAITNKSVEGNQLAQEHTVALKLAESQVESVKALSAAQAATITDNSQFCVLNNVVRTDINASCVSGPSNRYLTVVVRTSGTNYTVKTTWRGATNGNDNVTLKYRTY